MELNKLENFGILEIDKNWIISETARIFIIDASVFIKWFSKDREEDYEKAGNILNSHIGNRIKIISPEISIYELANVLYFKPGMDAASTELALREFLKLEIRFVGLDRELTISTNQIRYQHNITFYDAAYVATAIHFKTNLITADLKLFNSCKNLQNIELLKHSDF